MSERQPKLERGDLLELLTFARAMARGGGAVAMSYYGRARPSFKYDESLVTEADLAVQDYLRSEIAGACPEHYVLGEATSGDTSELSQEEPLWVIDPVDGTAAFSAAMPVWGVAIALFDNGIPVLGVYYQPVTEELYSAVHGGSAYLNDVRIQVRANAAIDNEALLLAYSRFHRDYGTTFPGKIRSLGSSVAHIAYVARGAAWGALLHNVHVWDVAAGVVILEAAGGRIRTLDNKEFDTSAALRAPGARIEQPLLAAAKGHHKNVNRYFSQMGAK